MLIIKKLNATIRKEYIKLNTDPPSPPTQKDRNQTCSDCRDGHQAILRTLPASWATQHLRDTAGFESSRLLDREQDWFIFHCILAYMRNFCQL